ncbi:SseB family protein [Rothia sp. ZJ932]|uniref:SseB family protein n=1 Tax=Rothia sp. ZJ932 TaxID=2810516 RepID=UPI001967D121|nr:SseB family protein [Rothia sp. ZJ932]QRZ61066.1 SseB family protein [Rothia sp. ZJ932]
MAEEFATQRSSSPRQLPAHIAAQLASAGRETDTGGQPWAGRNLGEGTSHTHQFPDDSGAADARLQLVLEAFADGRAGEAEVVAALRDTRVFAAVVAQLTQAHVTDEGLVSDKESDMALVSIQAPDGRKALPLFTSTEGLTSWHEQARPVAADIRKTALSAVDDGNQLLVINPGDDVTFVVRRPALWALAKDESWVPSYCDPEISRELTALAQGIGSIVQVRVSRGEGSNTAHRSGKVLDGGGSGPELKITLVLAPGLDREGLNTVVGAYQQKLATSQVISDKVDSVQMALISAQEH